ncbi:hypothetical protein KAJ89_04335 [Candidatus Parcubacteria bacterium]|nr:hypothetical protein [Candidatus Parcubacteria bacterium]
MDDFFDKNFIQGLVSGVIILVMGFLLVGESSKRTSSGKFWKVIIILGVGMMIGGIYLFITYFPDGGLYNIYASAGISILVFGYLLKKTGDFFNWWQR